MQQQSPKSPERTKGEAKPAEAAWAHFAEKVKASPEEVMDKPGATSDDIVKVEVAKTPTVQRHSMWDAEFATVGKKEAEHMSAQWKLIRQELGTFAGDLAALQLGLEEAKRSTHQAVTRVTTLLAGHDARIEEERGLRMAMEENLKHELQKLRADLQAEAKQREVDDRRIESELLTKQDLHEQSVHERCKDLPTIKDKLGNLHSTVSRVPSQLDALREHINQETRSREAGHDTAMRHLKDHKEAVPRLILEATRDLKPHKHELAELKDTLDKEIANRHSIVNPLHEKVHTAHKDIAQHKEDMGNLRRICEELEDSILPRIDAQQHAIDKLGHDEKSDCDKLESRLAELSAKIDTEVAVRTAFMGEVEQMLAPIKAKLRLFASEHADQVRQARDELETSIKDKLKKESDARDAQHKALQGQLSGHKAVLDTRLESIHKSHKDLEHKIREVPAQPAPDLAHVKKTEELARQVRQLQSRLPEEEAPRGTIVYPHEDQILYVEQFLKDTCERFIDGLQRRKHSLQPRMVLVEHPDPTEEKAATSSAKPGQAATEKDPAAKVGQSIGKEAPKVSMQELGSQKPKAVAIGSPNLNTEKEGQLKKVLAGKRIELVMSQEGDFKTEAEAFEAKLHLKDPLEFKAVHHGDMSAAQFSNEAKAMEVLSDVAEVLKVYHSASLLIEGHTATPPEKMDKWAHDLAHSRAEKVKAAIVALGVEAQRLGTVGLPGHLGSGKHDTVLKITSF